MINIITTHVFNYNYALNLIYMELFSSIYYKEWHLKSLWRPFIVQTCASIFRNKLINVDFDQKQFFVPIGFGPWRFLLEEKRLKYF
jgi:hypothetical protein